ncbi:MAG: 50S ribosomal protein L29 [Bacteroidetes bacterium CG12_big_fil_rev_8_21_14_0_65_60_17]|nr:MAG: 50S ribosomal protein L29 [Bacteroidetes bacterium CG12_big_fil_rev_8_21_14_0_65_60_17]
MKAKEIREMTSEELDTRIKEEQEQISQLQFQHAIADLPNPLVLRHKRRFLAQLRTIRRERQDLS